MSEVQVYAGNLSYNTTEADLFEHMRKAGEVLSVSIFRTPDGRSKGCALVSYCSMPEAERAVSELHDTVLDGRQVLVRHDEGAKTGKGGKGGPAQPSSRVYVGNLSFDVTWQNLKDHFAACGTVVRADVMKGYGIVEFETQEMASEAIETMNDGEFFGRTIHVREDRANSERNSYGGGKGGKGGGGGGGGKGRGATSGDPMCKVFVSNLSWYTGNQELGDFMSEVGHVVNVEILTEGGVPGGRSKGCAFVEFASHDAALSCVARLHDSWLGDRQLAIREFRP
uniref:RRM domain-containing protein n=1 Tax=Eutreptiella gymnastica TaxID=73025 RepID=A0A7S4G314_9EUGL